MASAPELAAAYVRRLAAHYESGFGIVPSAANEQFAGQLWARDFAFAAGSYYIAALPVAVRDSFDTFFAHQRADGALPYKVERQYALVRIIPGLGWLAQPLFRLFNRTPERALYEGEDTNGAEDTVPALVIACGMFLATNAGRPHAAAYYPHLVRAMEYFSGRVDPADGLAVVRRSNPDWAESIQRTGTLGFVNVLYVASLDVMARIAEGLGEDAQRWQKMHARTKRSLVETLYDRQGHYIRAKAGEPRLDTVASLLGALVVLDIETATRVEQTVAARASARTGLRNFDPPYPLDSIHLLNRLFGTSGYHNTYVWPWVTCLHLRLMARIMAEHPDDAVRGAYRRRAAEGLTMLTRVLTQAGGAYEVLRPDAPTPAASLLYRPSRDFLATLAGFVGVQQNVAVLA